MEKAEPKYENLVKEIANLNEQIELLQEELIILES
jgi:hypothetical protein